MILASCRRGFVSTEWFGPLTIRDYPLLPDTANAAPVQPGELTAAAQARRVLVVVHGYHNTFDSATAAYAQLETGLRAVGVVGSSPPAYDLVIGFLWPGMQTDLGFFPAIPWANRSAGPLRDLLHLLVGAACVDIETHSLGARVGLQALVFPGEPTVRNLLLTAPAVDDEVLEPGKEFYAALPSALRCFVYHSVHDPVLKGAYRFAEWDQALGYHGPQHPAVIAAACPSVYTLDCSTIIATHGGYRSSEPVLAHWARVLSGDALPRVEPLCAAAPEVVPHG